MQGTPYNLLQDEQFTLRQDADTAHPQPQIPIYLMHSGDAPFCNNHQCFCQCGKRAGAILYADVATGKLLLAQYSLGDQSTITDQATVYTMYTLLDETTPPDCQFYGHTWELTESLDVKECSICHIRGFCPVCTPQPPAGAQPFYCTSHTGKQVQQ